MTKWILKNLSIAFYLILFVGCGESGEESPQNKANENEIGQSSSEDGGWTPETTLPDPD